MNDRERMRGPMYFDCRPLTGARVSVGCLDCEWAAELENVKSSEAHMAVNEARIMFDVHHCGAKT